MSRDGDEPNRTQTDFMVFNSGHALKIRVSFSNSGVERCGVKLPAFLCPFLFAS